RQRAGMVVVQMRDDHLVDVAGRHAEVLQGGGWRAHHPAAAPGPLDGVEAGVDHDGALGVADHPDEVVDGVRLVVVVGADEALEALARRELGIFQRQDLIGIAAHRLVHGAWAPAIARPAECKVNPPVSSYSVRAACAGSAAEEASHYPADTPDE